MTQSKKQMSVHHICLSVKKFEESISFYKKLGFNETKKFNKSAPGSKGVLMKLDDFVLELFYYLDAKEKPEATLEENLREIGTNHFGISVDSLQKTFEELSKKGFKFVYPPKINSIGQKYAFIKDPNGIFVELIQKEKPCQKNQNS